MKCVEHAQQASWKQSHLFIEQVESAYIGRLPRIWLNYILPNFQYRGMSLYLESLSGPLSTRFSNLEVSSDFDVDSSKTI